MRRLLLLVIALTLAGCSPTSSEEMSACIDDLAAGDLVITEIMANPEGVDDGTEYFELYNASGQKKQLAGVVLELENIDGTRQKQHSMSSGEIPPEAYYALGNVLPEFAPAHIQYGYADHLGAMTNTGGTIRIRCGEVLVDEMSYGDSLSGHSLGLSGDIAPSHTANDDAKNLCNAMQSFETNQFGSPGLANEVCPFAVEGSCIDKESGPRNVVSPVVGDLVITELMPNPSAVPDAQGEWFELYANVDVDLNGLVLGREPGVPAQTLNETNCIAVRANEKVLFARSQDAGTNGGLPTPVQTFAFSLVNSDGKLFIGIGDEILDVVTWASSTPGTSRSLDPGSIDPATNDDEANWCDAQTGYGEQSKGTPLADNDVCTTELPTTTCIENGSPRAIVSPQEGELVITEIMANPLSVSDAQGEWFEVYIGADIDLNGVFVGRDVQSPSPPIQDSDCLSYETGDRLLFARSADSASNGGLPPVTEVFDFPLVNSDGTLFIGVGDTIIDVVQWQTSAEGASRSLTPSATDATANDDEAAWCTEETPYGDGDKGTPSSVNNDCP